MKKIKMITYTKILYLVLGLYLYGKKTVYAAEQKYPENDYAYDHVEEEKKYPSPTPPIDTQAPLLHFDNPSLLQSNDNATNANNVNTATNLITNPLVLLVGAANYAPTAHHKKKNIDPNQPVIIE